MDYYVGLDVSMHSVFVCIVDKQGKVIRENEIPCNPDAIGYYLKGSNLKIKTIGLESGSLTHYLKKGLMEMDFEVVGIEACKMAAILATTINKTDTNDARGIAEAVRTGHYKECIHRSDDSVEIRTVLHSRQTLIKERTHLTNSIKGHLKVYGIKLGKGKTKEFSKRVTETLSSLSTNIQKSIHSLLKILDTLNLEIEEMNKLIKELAKKDDDVQLLKTVDGVGDITALAFKAEIDDPHRFKNSKDVGAYLGLTPSQYSSGETKKQGRISKRGSKEVRSLLVEGALSLMTKSKIWSKHKAWGIKLSRKKGSKKAQVALARKLSVTMHRMLITKEPFKRSDKKKEELAA